jgi:hypothetical protein
LRHITASEFRGARSIARLGPIEMAVCAIALLGLAALLFWPAGLPLDDAYITMHNARVLLGGGTDPTYAGANALTGATSAVHLLLVTAFALVVPVPLAAKLAALCGFSLYATGLLELLRRTQLPTATRLSFLACGLLVGYLPYQLLNGLETGLAAAAVLWALLLIESRWLPLLCGILPFIRPELAFLSAPLMAQRLWELRNKPASAIRAVLMAAAGAAPWMLLYLQLTGSILPNTGAAKVFFFADGSKPLGLRLQVAAQAFQLCLFGPLWLGLVGLPSSRAGRAGLCFLICWLGIAIVTLPSGLWHNWYRYLTSAVPVLMVGWCNLLSRRPSLGRAAALILGGWTLITCIAGFRAYFDADRGAGPQMVAAVLRNVPAGEMIMIHDAGYIAWAAPQLHLVDAVGLKSPRTVGWREALAARPSDRARSLGQTAAAAHASYFIVLAHDHFWGELTNDLVATGWRAELIEDGGGRSRYAIYRITPRPSR